VLISFQTADHEPQGTFVALHRHPLRGDTAVALLVALYGALVIYGVPVQVGAITSTATASRALAALHWIALYLLGVTVACAGYRLSPYHPLASFPGPVAYKLTSATLAHAVYTGRRHLIIADLHDKYGKFVRVGEPRFRRLSCGRC
jgi:hypothetical protein